MIYEHSVVSTGESRVDAAGGTGRRAAPGSRQLLVGGALIGCVLSVVLVASDVHTPVRVAAALLLFSLAPGAALLSLVTPRGARLELGLVVALSLAVVVVLAETMLALHVWRPTYATYIVAAACSAVLIRGLLWPRDDGRVAPRSWSFLPRVLVARSTLAHMLLLGIALAAWILALHGADLRRLSGYGLLPALPVWYYVALVILAAGFVLALSQSRIWGMLPGVYVTGLVVVLHGTTAALYPEPRYTWMYKHLGVINSIAAHGVVHRDTDIYSNWPGFFAGNAWFKTVAGIAPISYGAWAQVFFELANAAALLFVVRGLTRDARLQWATVWLFLLGNWVGQDYVAPQALGFVVVLVVFGLVLRYAPPSDESHLTALRLWRGFTRRLAHGGTAPRPEERAPAESTSLSPRACLLLGAICSMAVVFSHQLSPIMLGVGLAAFMLATGRLRVSLLVALVALETGWILLAWHYLNMHFSLFRFDLLPRLRPPGYNAVQGLPGVTFVADMSHAVVAVLALLALAGVVQHWRSGRLNLAALGFLIAPIPIIGVQSYGGEIFLRAYLFSLPWLAYFAAVACIARPESSRHHLAGWWKLVLTTIVVGGGMLFSYFGLEKANYVTRDDVAVASWYEQKAPVGSVMGLIAASFPQGLTADYARVREFGDSYIPQLIDDQQLREHPFTEADLPELIALLRGAGAAHTYFAVSPSQENFVRLYGILSETSLRNLVQALQSSPSFRVVYRHGRAFVVQLTDDA